MASYCRRKLNVRRQAAADIGCSCTPKLFTSLFSSSSHSRAKPSKSTNNSSCLTSTTTYNTSFSWDPTGATSTTCSPLPPPPPPPLAPSERPKEAEAASAATRRSRRRKKKPATTAAAAAAGDVDEDGRVARESVAVVKETSEPYVAFKESMMQMIVEKEIYGWDDLNDLLHRFISLNSPRHHHVILTAFADLWNGVFSPPSPPIAAAAAAPPSAAAPEEDYSYIPATTTSPPTYHSYYY